MLSLCLLLCFSFLMLPVLHAWMRCMSGFAAEATIVIKLQHATLTRGMFSKPWHLENRDIPAIRKYM